MQSRQLPEGITPEAFVQAWQQSDDVSEVLSKLGLTNTSFTHGDATQFAGFLRRHGVELKKYEPRRRITNYESLRVLANQALTPSPNKA